MYSIFLSIYTSINICILIEDDKISLKKLFSSTKMKGVTKVEEIFSSMIIEKHIESN